MTLAELKTQLIQYIKHHYSLNIIEVEYPLFKQANIIRAGGGSLTTMSAYIDGKIADIDEIETAINALTDTTLLDSFVSVSDAADSAYVVAALSGLTDADQKIAVAGALRSLK